MNYIFSSSGKSTYFFSSFNFLVVESVSRLWMVLFFLFSIFSVLLFYCLGHFPFHRLYVYQPAACSTANNWSTLKYNIKSINPNVSLCFLYPSSSRFLLTALFSYSSLSLFSWQLYFRTRPWHIFADGSVFRTRPCHVFYDSSVFLNCPAPSSFCWPTFKLCLSVLLLSHFWIIPISGSVW